MRALLVVNPKATTTTVRSRDVLARTLRTEVDLRVGYTGHRGHAAELAAEAAADGMDAVVALGGDGTVNEVVNGLMRSGGTAGTLPALGVVPGGSTNVFARAVGLPNDWSEATGVILEALRVGPRGRTRTIGLGQADDRYFTFCAGFGFDAEVIRRVEEHRGDGLTSGPLLYTWAAFAQYVATAVRRRPTLTLLRPDGAEPTQVAMAVVQNCSPWTYFGGRPVDPSGRADFDAGLDLTAMRALHLPSALRAVRQTLSREPGAHGSRVLKLHDLAEFTLVGSRPLAFQLDGDYLGERETVTFRAVPAALRVLC